MLKAGKAIARVRLLVLPHAEEIGELIEAIEKTGRFEVLPEKDEGGSFTIVKKDHV